jgi:hypothetical protein
MTSARAGVLAGIAAVGIAAAAPMAVTAIGNRLTYGTFETSGSPPRIDYCGRRYYPGDKTLTAAQVDTQLARNHLKGITRIATAPSGMPIMANVMSPAMRAQYHTNVCMMEVWVRTGPDSYLPYGLSGGP